MRALACPASLKGVLAAPAAAAALAEGMRAGGAEAVELPVADGGEGTAEILRLARGGAWREADVHDAFGRPRTGRWLLLPDGTAVVEAAAAVPLDPRAARSARRFEPGVRRARGGRSRRRAVGAPALPRRHGDDGRRRRPARGRRAELPVPARVACDVTATLLEAPRLFGPQKGAGPAEVAELERRFAAREELVLIQHKPGGGAAGGLGAALALARRRARSGRRARARRGRLRRLRLRPRRHGRGARRCHDGAWESARRGRATLRRARAASSSAASSRSRFPVRETVALSGDPARARDDLVALGRDLVLKQH